MQVNAAALSCSNSPLQWWHPRSVESTTRLWPRLSLRSRLGGPLSRPLETNGAFVRECISCRRAHLLYPPDQDTDYTRRMIVWKIFFVVYGIINNRNLHTHWCYNDCQAWCQDIKDNLRVFTLNFTHNQMHVSTNAYSYSHMHNYNIWIRKL